MDRSEEIIRKCGKTERLGLYIMVWIAMCSAIEASITAHRIENQVKVNVTEAAR